MIRVNLLPKERSLPAADDPRAERRARVVARARELRRGGMSWSRADAVAAEEAGVGASSVARWRRRGGSVAALRDAPGRGRPRAMRDPEHVKTAEALLVSEGRHVGAAHIRAVLLARFGAAPGERSIARWVQRWRGENARLLSSVLDPDRHRSTRQPAFGAADAAVGAPNERWEIDSSPADLICTDGKRHVLLAAVDVWTRRAVVVVAATSRATAVCALIRRCLLAWGVPRTVVSDGGSDYLSLHVRGVYELLGIEHRVCPPRTPDAKPHVESFFRTVQHGLIAHLPGFTGHNVAEAAAIRQRKSWGDRRGRDVRELYGVALGTDDLRERLDAWCADLYERRPHSALGTSPFERAASWTEPLRRIEDERALDVLLAVPAGRKGGKATVLKGSGVRVDGGRYIAPELGPLVGEEVAVRQDLTDFGRIYVWRAGGDGRFVCVAEDPARTGMDRAAVAAAAKARAKAADREGREYARDLKKLHSPATAMDDVLAHASGRARKVTALPRRSVAHAAPALEEAGRAAREAAAAQERTEAPPPRKRAVVGAVRKLLLEDG